jgi:hypothetical protein
MGLLRRSLGPSGIIDSYPGPIGPPYAPQISEGPKGESLPLYLRFITMVLKNQIPGSIYNHDSQN